MISLAEQGCGSWWTQEPIRRFAAVRQMLCAISLTPRFSGVCAAFARLITVLTVSSLPQKLLKQLEPRWSFSTPLKRGVNEISVWDGAQTAADSRNETVFPEDEFAAKELTWQLFWIGPVVLCCLLGAFSFLSSGPHAKPSGTVIAYCAQDQTYAEEIFRDFQKETGVKVRAVYDSEAVKTVGLANRLLAERSHPQCDVFWGNEEMRARQLAEKHVFRETNGLAFFGYRSRCLVYNTSHVAEASAPHSLLELTNATWRGKVALAYPQFGTTAAHFHALGQEWGSAAWENWCRALVANKALLVDGNSVVVKMVGRGEAWIGLTDSDDIAAGQEDGLPVAAASDFKETLLIPNTVGIIRGAPHLAAAQKLFDYLQQPATVQKLVAAKALQGRSMLAASNRGLKVDWSALLKDLDSTTEKLNGIFLR